MKELRELQKRRRQKRAFSALASALETATTETDHTAEANEPTHTDESHLESIMKASQATVDECFEAGPPPSGNPDIPRKHTHQKNQTGNKEAAA